MSDVDLVRCRGCAVMNPPGLRECLACGTLMPRAQETRPRAQPTAADHLRGLLGAERARGVLRLFVALVGLVAAAAVAHALAVPPATLELGIRLVFVLLAVVCGLAARPEVGALLTRSAGWRGLLLAGGGFGVMVSVGAVYFRTLTWLGFPVDNVPNVYVAAGWSRWTPLLLDAAAPAVTEEVIFRGYAMARLDGVLSARESLVVQAALFALLHLGVIIFPSHFAMGLLFGALRRRTYAQPLSGNARPRRMERDHHLGRARGATVPVMPISRTSRGRESQKCARPRRCSSGWPGLSTHEPELRRPGDNVIRRFDSNRKPPYAAQRTLAAAL